MAIKKVIYFTAGTAPDENEQAEIDLIAANPAYSVSVRNATLQTTDPDADPEAADYVAGSPPSDYDDPGDYPVLDISNIPTASLVEEGDTIVLTDASGTTLNCTLVVTDGVPTLTMASTAKIIKSGVEFLSPAVSGSRTDGYTPTIVAGDVTVLAGS